MFENSDGKTVVTKREDISMDKETTVEEIQEGYFEEPEHHVYLQDNGTAQNVIYETASVQHIPEFSGNSHQINEVVNQSDEEHQVTSPPKPKERKRKASWDEAEDDDNKFFAMSLACSLRRLSTINNLKAKVEIFQVLEKLSSKQEQENSRK